ncbi:MAG: pilus assembly protein [Caldilinea sp. CFX5]|nr:pilus assembly protein [Caldilinea sp. CFX5]
MTHRMQIKDERGTTLIEFTVVLTILLALTFGMIDFARYVYAISVVRAAAQEGAWAGLHRSTDEATAEATAKEKMIALDLDHASVDVQKGAKIVNATVTYQFEFITPLGSVASLLGAPTDETYSTVVITGTASMVIPGT